MKINPEIPYYHLWFHEVVDGVIRFTCFRNLRGGGNGAPESEAREASAKILNLPESKIMMIPSQGSSRPDPAVALAEIPNLRLAMVRVKDAEKELQLARRAYSDIIRALEDRVCQNGIVIQKAQ